MEANNPGGSGKDRAAMYMLLDAAKQDKRFHETVNFVEGTSGSTGISLALICQLLGKTLHVVMPDDQSKDKVSFLGTLLSTSKLHVLY